MSEKKTYDCPNCGKQYKSNSGLWKHKKKCIVAETVEPAETLFKDPAEDNKTNEEIIEETKEKLEDANLNEIKEDLEEAPDWLHYEPTIVDENATESIPAAVKFASKAPTGSFSRDTNKSLLLMGYGATDQLLSWYANAVTAGEIPHVQHDMESKEWTADITLDWMEESGFDLSTKLTKGNLALMANGYYVGAPLVKIQKESKVEVAAELGQKFARWPLIGKWMQRRAARKNKKDLAEFSNRFSNITVPTVKDGVYDE